MNWTSLFDDLTAPLPCLNPAAPASNADLRVTRDLFGTTATYTCPPGWYIAEGGTRRTLGCTNGTWPHTVPMCTGIQTPLNVTVNLINIHTSFLKNHWPGVLVVQLYNYSDN